jgi:hypothetical protein
MGRHAEWVLVNAGKSSEDRPTFGLSQLRAFVSRCAERQAKSSHSADGKPERKRLQNKAASVIMSNYSHLERPTWTTQTSPPGAWPQAGPRATLYFLNRFPSAGTRRV